MQFIYPPFTFGVNQLASTRDNKGFNARKLLLVMQCFGWVMIDFIFMMVVFRYTMLCERSCISRFNETQSEKVYAGVTLLWSYFWFYPSQTNSVSNGTEKNGGPCNL